MSTSSSPPKRKRRPRRRKRTHTETCEDNDGDTDTQEPQIEPQAKKAKLDDGDFLRRSQRTRKKVVTYNDDQCFKEMRLASTKNVAPVNKISVDEASASQSSSSSSSSSNNVEKNSDSDSNSNTDSDSDSDSGSGSGSNSASDDSNQSHSGDESESDASEIYNEDEDDEEHEEGNLDESQPPLHAHADDIVVDDAFENVELTEYMIRNCRSCRTLTTNNAELTETERAFKRKACTHINGYFENNFRNAQQTWRAQKQKYKSQNDEIAEQKRNITVSGFAQQSTVDPAVFASMRLTTDDEEKMSKYLHVTSTVYTDQSLIEHENENENSNDEIVEACSIALNEESCPIPHATPYVSINRTHFMKDDKRLRYIPQIRDSLVDSVNALELDLYASDDSDTEFEECEDVLLEFADAQLDEVDTATHTRCLRKLFHLNMDRISHRMMALSLQKQKTLRAQEQQLKRDGVDTKNKDIPIDSFSLLFCPRCATYDCSLHGLDHPRRKHRALPSDAVLAANCDYFGIINERVADPNALADAAGNHSRCNDLIPSLLSPQYQASVTYPSDLCACEACSDDCFIHLEKMREKEEEDSAAEPHEWRPMELANLRRLLNICKKNFCQIAAILGDTITCRQVYLQSKQLMPSLRSYRQERDPREEHTKHRKNALVAMAKSSATSSSSTKAVAATDADDEKRATGTATHQFFGCKHDGACSAENDCSCIGNHAFCEKFCGCSMDCAHRFAGCDCKRGQCRTAACPCFAAHRECDPDRCRSCQSYLPPHIASLVMQWMRDNEATNSELNEDQKAAIEIAVGDSRGITPYTLCANCACTQERKKRLWIGRSDIHGFGCFAAQSIKRDEFVTEYVGELISQMEADRRGKVYDEQYNISYLFNLNEEYCIDATRKGCKMKFANHSIAPNCRAKIVTVNGDHRICIYAQKDLAPGDELLFDYRHDNVDNAQQPNWFHHNQK